MIPSKRKVSAEDRIAVSIRDATEMTGLGRNSLYNLINAGTLASYMIGGRRLIRVSDLQKLFEKRD
jgi:excisionase family DNA binding protein